MNEDEIVAWIRPRVPDFVVRGRVDRGEATEFVVEELGFLIGKNGDDPAWVKTVTTLVETEARRWENGQRSRPADREGGR